MQIGSSTFALPGGVQEIGLGVVMILILMFRPAGIMGNRELTLPWPRARAGQEKAPDATGVET